MRATISVTYLQKKIIFNEVKKNYSRKKNMNNSQDEDNFFNEFENQKEKIRLQKAEEIKGIPPSQFICRKCGQKDVNYHLKSIRRNDEPPVLFFSCSCKNTWSSRG